VHVSANAAAMASTAGASFGGQRARSDNACTIWLSTFEKVSTRRKQRDPRDC
jgi:hypothetical protein